MKRKILDKKTVEEIISIYSDAWINQDSNKIISIFTPDAVYHEKVLEKPYVCHKEIKQYWKEKIVKDEKNIDFKLLNIYIDGYVAIVEWEAIFLYKGKKTLIREVAILEIEGSKIKSLREYWHSK